jgi:signal transduction histidine kinase
MQKKIDSSFRFLNIIFEKSGHDFRLYKKNLYARNLLLNWQCKKSAMDGQKEKLLHETYGHFLNTCITTDISLSTLDEILVHDVMGFGTTIDETLFSSSEFLALIERQREQSKDMQITWRFDPQLRRISGDENSAVFADDLTVTFVINNETLEIFFRFSAVFEYIDRKWKVVHWHGSKPEYVQSDVDTFGIQDWKQKTEALEKLVAERTFELTKQKEALEQALQDLHSTQSQLIQSEKMASLGELTAGIAHEIQNPLNFVNNFSDVSNELIDEMNEELDKGDLEEAKAIAGDIKQNLEKITHHGKRADAIVKSMLQHSRASSNSKESTDLNKLADEYLRLAYHGLRAKEQSFNAKLETDFDNTIDNINIIPQDMGRVMLNLITNAFYAVDEKQRGGIDGYEPTVSVSTKREDNDVVISVKDNGNGIPQQILDKVFHPFFTTKPTGQGTGLGLSLAYDIVKAHGGELKVTTAENKGTTFTIQLPNTQS